MEFENDKLQEYIYIEKIGESKQARIIKVKEKNKDKYYTLKLLKENNNLTLFQEEISILNTIKHDNIISMHNSSSTNTVEPFMLMDYMKYGNICNYLNSQAKTVSVNQKLFFIKQIAEALKYIHDNNYIHRNVKPSNIFITENEKGKHCAYLGDFSIAKQLKEEQTETGGGKGTASFLPPEAFSGNEPSKKANDIYGLGMSMYKILAGTHPSNPLDSCNSSTNKILAPSILNSSLDSTIDNICLKSISQTKEERYKSIDTFLHDIESCLESRLIGSTIQNSQKKNKGNISNKKLYYLTFALTGLMLSTFFGTFYWKKDFSQVNKKILELEQTKKTLPNIIKKEKEQYHNQIKKRKEEYKNKIKIYLKENEIAKKKAKELGKKNKKINENTQKTYINNIKEDIQNFNTCNFNKENWKEYIAYEKDILKSIELKEIDQFIKENLRTELRIVKYNNIYKKIIKFEEETLNSKKITEDNKEFYYILSKKLLNFKEIGLLKKKKEIIERLGNIFRIYMIDLGVNARNNISSINQEAKYRNTIESYSDILNLHLSKNNNHFIFSQRIIESYENMVSTYMLFSQDNNKYKKGEKHLKRLHKIFGQGGLSIMGDIYFIGGYGVTKNPEKAIECYKKAVDERNGIAALKLATLYRSDLEVEKNTKESEKYYQKAIELNVNANMLIASLKQDAQSLDKYMEKSIKMYEEIGGTIYIGDSLKVYPILQKNKVYYSLEEKIWRDKYLELQDSSIFYLMLSAFKSLQYPTDVEKVSTYFKKGYKSFTSKESNLNFKNPNKHDSILLYPTLMSIFCVGLVHMEKQDPTNDLITINYIQKFSNLLRKFKQENDTEETIIFLESRDDPNLFNINNIYETLDIAAAFLYERIGDNNNVKKSYETAIQKGHIEEHEIARAYQEGDLLFDDPLYARPVPLLSMKKNYKKALEWHEKAIEQGFYTSFFHMAEIFQTGGYGVEKNYYNAKICYQKAVNKGLNVALIKIGKLYEEGGPGIKKNSEKAHEYYSEYTKNARKEIYKGIQFCEQIAKKEMSAIFTKIKKRYELKANKLKLNANIGSEKVSDLSNYNYKEDKKTKDKLQKTLDSRLRKAHFGDIQSIYSLGELYKNGKYLKEDYQKAKHWYNEAINQGDTKGLFHIGQLYVEGGIGLEKDLIKADEYFNEYVKKDPKKGYQKIIHYYKQKVKNTLHINNTNHLIEIKKEYYKQAIKWYKKWEEESEEDKISFLIGKFIINEDYFTESFYQLHKKSKIDFYKQLEENTIYSEKIIIGTAIGYEASHTHIIRHLKYKKAEEWFQKYSENSGIKSIEVGNFYRKRYIQRKTREDYKEAIRWYNIASSQGETLHAKKNIEDLNKKMSKIEYKKFYRN